MKAEPLFTANRLALLSKLDRRAVERKLVGVAPAKIEGKARFYSLASALPALTREPGDAAQEARIRALKERQQESETRTAELAQEAREKKLCTIATAKFFVSEAITILRQTVERAEFLTEAQKTKLLKRVAASPPALPPEPVASIAEIE